MKVFLKSHPGGSRLSEQATSGAPPVCFRLTDSRAALWKLNTQPSACVPAPLPPQQRCHLMEGHSETHILRRHRGRGSILTLRATTRPPGKRLGEHSHQDAYRTHGFTAHLLITDGENSKIVTVRRGDTQAILTNCCRHSLCGSLQAA